MFGSNCRVVGGGKLSRLSRLCSPPVPGTECPVSPENESGGDSQVRAGEGSNLGLARAAVSLRVTRGVYFARTVPNQPATDALALWAGPPKTTQPLPGVQMATACPTRGTPSASVATCGGVESPNVYPRRSPKVGAAGVQQGEQPATGFCGGFESPKTQVGVGCNAIARSRGENRDPARTRRRRTQCRRRRHPSREGQKFR